MNDVICEAAHPETGPKTDVKTKLGKGLIETIDVLQYNFYVEDEESFEEYVRESYEDLRETVGFSLIEEYESEFIV